MTDAVEFKFELTEPRTDAELEEYYRLRYERLRKPLGLPPGAEREDPAEPASLHVIAKADGRIVAAGCWAMGMRRAEGRRIPFVRFRQMAVDPDYEGRGIGSAIMRYVEASARAMGAEEILGNVRMENVTLFKHHGYVEQGSGVTLYGQVESLAMVRPLR
jgi:GNAT superfamily N-acetyltransferase